MIPRSCRGRGHDRPGVNDTTQWLIDKSAVSRLEASPDAEEWVQRIERGVVKITTVTLLELGYSARSQRDLRDVLHRPPIVAMPVEYLTPSAEDRALDVLLSLAGTGQHRGPSTPDLLVSAVAELAGLTVLHLDKDFDLIAGITGQPVERLVTLDA
jgi:predicted nucleic acid-binding protein